MKTTDELETLNELKTREILRLHGVCRSKDEAIRKAIECINSLGLIKAMDCANELKEYLG